MRKCPVCLSIEMQNGHPCLSFRCGSAPPMGSCRVSLGRWFSDAARNFFSLFLERISTMLLKFSTTSLHVFFYEKVLTMMCGRNGCVPTLDCGSLPQLSREEPWFPRTLCIHTLKTYVQPLLSNLPLLGRILTVRLKFPMPL